MKKHTPIEVPRLTVSRLLALIANPNEEKAQAGSLARQELSARREAILASRDIPTSDEFALLAVDTAALACCFRFHIKALAVLAVECACEAARSNIDVAAVETAALL